MTVQEWNQLKAGDDIRCIDHPEIVYKVDHLGQDEDWADPGEDAVISHQIWIDPLLPPTEPYWPDVTPYDAGEAERFEPAEPPVSGRPREEAAP